MEIVAQLKNNVLYIWLTGEIDEHSAALSRRKADKIAEETVCESVVFDLGGVSFMDSTGIGFLIGRYKKFQRLGVAAYITNPSVATDRILTMSGVYALMPKRQ